MSQPNWTAERAAIERVANDLRQKGYEVVTDPPVSELPDFLREYRPNIVARSSKECLVVEVKQLLSSAERERVRKIAHRVESRPGWRFLLVSPEPSGGSAPSKDTLPLEVQQIRDWLTEAQTLVKTGHSRAALMVAWAGVEGAMRLAAQAHGISAARSESWSLMRELSSEGVLARDSYSQLAETFRLRSAFAHGMQPEVPPGTDIDASVVTLVGIAEELLKESATADRGASA